MLDCGALKSVWNGSGFQQTRNYDVKAFSSCFCENHWFEKAPCLWMRKCADFPNECLVPSSFLPFFHVDQRGVKQNLPWFDSKTSALNQTFESKTGILPVSCIQQNISIKHIKSAGLPVLVSVLGLYLFLFLACTCSFVLLLCVPLVVQARTCYSSCFWSTALSSSLLLLSFHPACTSTSLGAISLPYLLACSGLLSRQRLIHSTWRYFAGGGTNLAYGLRIGCYSKPCYTSPFRFTALSLSSFLILVTLLVLLILFIILLLLFSSALSRAST